MSRSHSFAALLTAGTLALAAGAFAAPAAHITKALADPRAVADQPRDASPPRRGAARTSWR
jgi:hypothetical protein